MVSRWCTTLVKYQVRRLVHHPSIVVWSGNNENEQAITQNWFAVTRMDPYTYAVRGVLHAYMFPAPACSLTCTLAGTLLVAGGAGGL